MIDLETLNYTGFTENQIEEIKKTCKIFSNFRFSSTAKDWEWLRIDGRAFSDHNMYIYYINPCGKNGFKVLVVPYGKTCISFIFGIVFVYNQDELTEIIPYHHPMD